MKILKFTGKLPGPVHSSELLSEPYDFTEGTCEMTDVDANLLLMRSGGYYRDVTEITLMTKAAAVPEIKGPKS